jgi:hypothetical protein
MPRLSPEARFHLASHIGSDRRQVSKPVTATLTSDDAEGDLRAFIRDQRATFDIVHFACGFRPARGERLEMASLEIYLYGQHVLMSPGGGQHRSAWPMESSDPADYPDPIAWSMQPLVRSSGSGDRTATVRVGANLKLVSVGVDHSRKSKDQICIQARGELTSNPNWTIKRTRVYTLDCDERFVLIVRRELRARLYMWLDLKVNGRYRGIFGGKFSGEADSSLYVSS